MKKQTVKRLLHHLLAMMRARSNVVYWIDARFDHHEVGVYKEVYHSIYFQMIICT